jgi:hypothetical protein
VTQQGRTRVAAVGPHQTKLCFVIGPIGDPESETRKRSDQVLKHVFAKAVEDLGFTVERADQISQPGMITVQVLRRVLEAPLVIADLSDRNPNVFYELAVRHAAEKPVIHAIDSSQDIPFDVADLRTVKFDYKDLDSVERAIVEIREQARQIESGHRAETPVKLAAVIQKLGAGGSELEAIFQVVLREILSALARLRADLQPLIEAESKRGLVATLAGTPGSIFGSTVPVRALVSPLVPTPPASPSLSDLSQQIAELNSALKAMGGKGERENKPSQAGRESAEPDSPEKSKA